MKITFLGTRGYIDARTKLHYRHTSTLFSYKRTNLLFDCGQDWLGNIPKGVHAIFVTHAHPDHAWGLQEGASCPVYASKESWLVMKKYPIAEKHIISSRKKIKIGPFTIQVFTVAHSLRAPAVSYKITAGKKTVLYSGDLVYIEKRAEALKHVDLYIGDGATLQRPLIRKRGKALIGHTPIQTQLTWCKKAGIKRAIFTHCGTQIVQSDPKEVLAKVKALARKREVEATIAYDGMKMRL